MTDQAQLERRYRRLLRCYPRGFRREHEEEMLVVLMAGGPTGRRRPGLADSANLVVNGLLMRARLRTPRSTPSVFWAVRLMALGAVLELVALFTVIATRGDLTAAIAGHYPAMPAAHIRQLVNSEVLKIAIGAPVAAGVWLWLAWANDRGHCWARGLLIALFGLASLSLLAAVGQRAVTLAPVDVIAGAALWLVALVALALIISPPSDGHYRRRGDAGGSRNVQPVRQVGASSS